MNSAQSLFFGASPQNTQPSLLIKVAMVETSDRESLWIMSRQHTLDESLLEKLRDELTKLGILAEGKVC